MSLGTDPASGTEPGFRGPDPIVEAAIERRRNRSLAFAGLTAGAVGVVAVAWALFGQTRAPAPAPQRAPATQVATAPMAPLPPLTPASYAPPDRDAVSRGYADVGRVYHAGGASELARTSRDCYERLQQTPAYALLDYCLAFDAFAAAALRREVDMDILPSGSWFDRAPQRGLRVAQAMMGPEGDAAARLLDIRRMALELGHGQQVARADPAPGTPAIAPAAPGEGL